MQTTFHGKQYWHKLLKPYMEKSVAIASRQLLVTFLLYAGVWYAYSLTTSPWLIALLVVLQSFVILRCFVLMHDCGHGAMFASSRANKFFGFLLGVLTGMPQYVWSKNHAYHHATNGDWESYHGPLNILSTQEYAKLSEKQQKRYWLFRHPGILIFAGFFYVLFNPRFNWLVGSLKMSWDYLKALLTGKDTKHFVENYKSKFWKSPKAYWHMTYNNLVLFVFWFAMCRLFGVADFALFYVLSLSIAGSLGILFFVAQHNFEKSYATDKDRVDYYRAAIEGTSLLVLPRILNWFTADIAYHHVHHLSVAIPNYRLVQCHRDLEEHFGKVPRLTLSDVWKSMYFQLWDREAEMIVSKKQYENSLVEAPSQKVGINQVNWQEN